VWVIQQAICEIAEGRGHRVAGLQLQAFKVEALAGQPRRRAGLEPAQIQAQPGERPADAHGRAFADAPAFGFALALVHEGPHEGAGGQHHGLSAQVKGLAHAVDRSELSAAVGRIASVMRAVRPADAHAHAATGFQDEVVDGARDRLQIWPCGQHLLHRAGVGVFVTLAARAVHRRALALVEHAELDARGVGHPAHEAAQGVDLADDLALGQAADGRVAAHGAGLGRVHGDQRHPAGGCQQVGRGPGGLGPRVAATDHHHVVEVAVAHAEMIRNPLSRASLGPRPPCLPA